MVDTMTEVFETARQPMVSGLDEAQKWIYRKVEKDKEVWLIPINHPAPGEQVHIHYPGEKSDGYGGHILEFPLEDGSIYKAQGPWHSNAEHLFSSTGIDLRNQHRTFGCVALHREYIPNTLESRFTGILYLDSDWVVGSFDRVRDIARKFATDLTHPVFCYSRSKGGSSSGMEYPEGTGWEDWKNYTSQLMPG